MEILLIDEGAQIRDLNEYFKEYYSGKNADKTIVTSGVPENIEAGNNAEGSPAPEEAVGEGGGNAANAASPEGTDGSASVPPDTAQSLPREAHSQEKAKAKSPLVAGVSREIPGIEE